MGVLSFSGREQEVVYVNTTYSATLLPDLGMLPREDLRIEEAVALCRGSLRIDLSSDHDMLTFGKAQMLRFKGVIDRVEMKFRVHFA
jgi:hypothetical protein